jgi:predicted metal-binding protein
MAGTSATTASNSSSTVVGFVKCECPGRSLVPNLGMMMKLSEIRPDRIHMSSCFATAD